MSSQLSRTRGSRWLTGAVRRLHAHRLRRPALAGGLLAAAGVWAGCGGGGSPVALTAVPDVRGLEVARAASRICDAGLVPRLAITRVLVPLYPAQPAGLERRAAAAGDPGDAHQPRSGRARADGERREPGRPVPGNIALAARRRCG